MDSSTLERHTLQCLCCPTTVHHEKGFRRLGRVSYPKIGEEVSLYGLWYSFASTLENDSTPQWYTRIWRSLVDATRVTQG